MSNPNRPFYVREITRKIDEQINSVRRELANLLSLGVITSDSSNNKLYYEVDQSYEHYSALRELFTGKKSSNKSKAKASADKDEEKEIDTKDQDSEKAKVVDEPVSAVDKKIWDKVGNISGLLYSGAFTRDKYTPVDVLIIGDVSVPRAESAVAELEKQEDKELRYAVLEVEEWKYRKQLNDKFWSLVMQAKNQIIIDKDNLFEQK